MSSSGKGDVEKARYWQRTISEAARSGMSVRAFCRQRQLRESQFYRKNWMFCGSDNGGQTAAVLTSLIATGKRLGMDPFAYLRDLFGRIAAHPNTRLAELLPDQWNTGLQPTPTS
jgi:hypothetical protein